MLYVSLFHDTRGIAQNPRGIAQNLRGVAQNPRGVGQICQLNLLIKIIFVFYPQGIAQNPRGVAQNPWGYPPGCSMFFTSLTLLRKIFENLRRVISLKNLLREKLSLICHLHVTMQWYWNGQWSLPLYFSVKETIRFENEYSTAKHWITRIFQYIFVQKTFLLKKPLPLAFWICLADLDVTIPSNLKTFHYIPHAPRKSGQS